MPDVMKSPKRAISEEEMSKFISKEKESREEETTRRLAEERSAKIRGRDAGEVGTKWDDLFKKK